MNDKQPTKEQILRDIQDWSAQKPVVTTYSEKSEKEPAQAQIEADIKAWVEGK